MKTNHKVINGDSRNMLEIFNNSVNLVITSPPYWQLKDYGTQEQIGFNHSYEEYINNLNLVWSECYRVLTPGCKLCINIGDQFARAVYYGRYKVIPIRTEIIKFCESVGFDYMGSIIWQKKTTMNTTGGASIMGSFPYPRNGIIEIDYEFILIFKKHGEGPKITKDTKELSKLSKEEWKEYFSGHWNFNGVRQDKHIAMFPEELPKRLIKMFSFVGETVLDPFAGSGTTNLVAAKLGRNSFGYEINPYFIDIIREKLSEKTLFDNHIIEFVLSKNSKKNFEKEIKKLPYIFSDPIKFDKKVDPNKLKFGSKISQEDTSQKQQTYRIKKILSADTLELTSGLKVKLIGIKSKEDKIDEAVKFLEKKLLGQQILLKYDEKKFDTQNILLSYVYLKNKTFINAHLIKNGLADVDDSYDFKYQKKFYELKN